METLMNLIWIPGWMAVGAGAYAADARWGLPLCTWCVNMCSAEPRAPTAGFLVHRTVSVKLVWSLALAGAAAVMGVAWGSAAWYSALPFSILEALACLAGMHLAPAAAWAHAHALRALDRMDRAEQDARAGVPGALERVKAAARSFAGSAHRAVASAKAIVARTSAPQAQPAPRPTFEEERDAKIAAMNRILGRQ